MTEDTPRIKDYRRIAKRYAQTIGPQRRTILGNRLDCLWDEMSAEERERLMSTWRDPR